MALAGVRGGGPHVGSVPAHGAALITAREGKVTQLKTFQSEAEALKAVRLSQ
jgi:hypothetical protein